MAHHHHHAPSTGKVLYLSLAATLAFTLLEALAGFRSNSLALLSDAGHNFTDALALILAAVGYYLQSKPADSTKTYGYGRAGVVTAFLNAATLIVISFVIIWEAIVRLIHPNVPDALTMIWVAAAGLILNTGIAIALHRGHQHDINIKSAVIHMVGDAIGAVAIILGGLAIRYSGLAYIDPILSILLGLFIVYTAWDITSESLNILLEGLPRGIELNQVTQALSQVQGVLDIHDLHIWSLGSNVHALSSHVLIDDMPHSASEKILRCINETLRALGIHHTTIQFEHVPCVLAKEDCFTLAQKKNVCSHQH